MVAPHYGINVTVYGTAVAECFRNKRATSNLNTASKVNFSREQQRIVCNLFHKTIMRLKLVIIRYDELLQIEIVQETRPTVLLLFVRFFLFVGHEDGAAT